MFSSARILGFFNLTGKYKKMQTNPKGTNVWIDPNGYKKYIADTQALRDKLIAEQTAAGPPAPRGGDAVLSSCPPRPAFVFPFRCHATPKRFKFACRRAYG